jgi:hypothetical protein
MARSSKKNYPSNSTTALVPRSAAAPLQAGVLPSGRRAVQATQALSEQIHIDDARSDGMLSKTLFAEQREHQLTLRTLVLYDQFAQAVRLVLDQPRDDRIQAMVEEFANILGPVHAQALLDTHSAGIQALQTIAAELLHAAAYTPEVVEITEEPPFLAKLLGARTKTTRITR